MSHLSSVSSAAAAFRCSQLQQSEWRAAQEVLVRVALIRGGITAVKTRHITSAVCSFTAKVGQTGPVSNPPPPMIRFIQLVDLQCGEK